MSYQPEKFEIVFENEAAEFREGSKVTGMVVIENAEDMQYTNIRIELRGTAIVFWGAQDEKGRSQTTGVEPNDTTGDCNKEQYFQKVVLLEKDDAGSSLTGESKDLVLCAGQTSLPFVCRLLAELPSSFEGRYGQVRYEAHAIITQSTNNKSTDVIVKRPFTVMCGLDLSFVSEASAKIEICKYREIGMCCTEGSITFDWLVDRSGFLSGEDIWIQGSVQNDSKQTVSKSVVTLFMVVDYRANKKRRQEKKSIASVEKGSTQTDDVTVWNEPIHIPDVPPTGLNRCRLIDIRYELEFRATIEGGSQPVVVTKEVYIGTVPLVIRPSNKVAHKSLTWGFDDFQRPAYDDWSSVDVDLQCPAITPGQPYYYNPIAGYPCPAAVNSTIGDVAYSSPGRFSLTDLIAATISSSNPAADPSAPLMAALDPPADELRPPPFAPGHESSIREAKSVSETNQTASSSTVQAAPNNSSFESESTQCHTSEDRSSPPCSVKDRL